MEKDYYKECLKDAMTNLIRVNESIFENLIEISMQGELKEWNRSVPVGETHQFDFEIFRNSNDINIQLLVKLIESVDATYESIRNINNLPVEE